MEAEEEPQTSIGLSLITQERLKQLEKWGIEQDAQYTGGELFDAARDLLWVVSKFRDNVSRFEKKQNLVLEHVLKLHPLHIDNTLTYLRIAGALIAAELDRLIASEYQKGGK